MLDKVALNFKISISCYQKIAHWRQVALCGGYHSVSTHSTQPSGIYIRVRTSSVPVRANCCHKMKTFQRILLALTIALLFLVGKYGAIYTGVAV
jgi:hypothetical protein